MESAETINRCANIIQKAEKQHQLVVIVSAMHGVTDELIALSKYALINKTYLIKHLRQLEEKHRLALEKIIPTNAEKQWHQNIAPLFHKLEYILYGIMAVGEVSDKTLSTISSFGEKLSSWLMHYALLSNGLKNIRISAEEIICTNSNYLEADVDYPHTKKICKKQ